MQKSLVSPELTDLYNDYYKSGHTRKREIMAIDTVGEIVRISAGLSVKSLLDVGSGDGAVLQELERRDFCPELYAVEISSSGIAATNQLNLKTLVKIESFTGYDIPFQDKQFDVAMSSHVLEHVEHTRLFLQEVARVAKYTIIIVPLEGTLRVDRNRQRGISIGHINFYNFSTFQSILDTSGLKILKSYQFTSSPDYEKFVDPKLGTLKGLFRNLVLRVMPSAANHLMNYYGIALCEPAAKGA